MASDCEGEKHRINQEELPPSSLGTKEHWDDTYAAELANFASNGDEGEVWFGEDSLFRVLRWFDGNVNAADTAVLDVGCGNGITSVHLAAAGYKDVVGVDYSEAAIALSRKVAEKHKAENVAFEVGDILKPDSSPALQRTYDAIIDKGTYDAVSLHPEDAGKKRRRYISTIHGCLRDKGIFAITSCNWTEQELISDFGKCFEVVEVLPTPQFTFGGIVGNMVTSIVFRRRDCAE